MSVAYSCAIENGDAHLKNFGVLCDVPEDQVWLGTKQFPTRPELIRFIRRVTSTGERAALEIIERVVNGVSLAIGAAQDYAQKHSGACKFADRLVDCLRRGLARLGCTPKLY